MSAIQRSVDRRKFLKGAAAGGAALGVAAAIPGLLIGREGGDESTTVAATQGVPLSEPMVAYVRDAVRGEVVLLVGTQEIVVRDALLASRLAAASRRGQV